MFNPFSFLNKNKIRVRIAPSPTGYLHIGTARTALFNWLFAKKYKGKFILRIEDTDLERSEKRFEDDILKGLKWLGLDWDEGPYRQSERLDLYAKYLEQLLKEKKAYYCPHTKEELEKEREWQVANNAVLIHNCDARNKNLNTGELIRFKIPEISPNASGNETTYPAHQIVFDDIIRGQVHFFTSLLGDFALAKNLRTPLYNFAVVIDDFEMRISHVIRGEDHIANTPKQILLQEALGFTRPKYAHLPLILDPDRSKMSKRHSATAIQEYKESGYLPETLVNFIALLGWHPQDDKEKISINELIGKFGLDRIQKGGAVFDVQKLNWLNSEYLKEKTAGELLKSLIDLYGEEKIIFKDKNNTLKLLELERSRMEKLGDFLDLKNNLLLKEYDANLLIWKNTGKEKIKENLRTIQEITRSIFEHEFNQKKLEIYLMPFANQQGRGEVLWPLRAALSGRDKSPGPFELMDILGKDEVLKRIEIAIKKLES